MKRRAWAAAALGAAVAPIALLWGAAACRSAAAPRATPAAPAAAEPPAVPPTPKATPGPLPPAAAVPPPPGRPDLAARPYREILDLKKAGASDQALLDRVRSGNRRYDLTTSEIRELRDAGVPENVVEAMLRSGR